MSADRTSLTLCVDVLRRWSSGSRAHPSRFRAPAGGRCWRCWCRRRATRGPPRCCCCRPTPPPAAAVGPEIARFSGRAFTPLDGLVSEEAVAELRAEAAMGQEAVLDAAVAELRELAEARTPDPSTGTSTAS